jgi:hypothetical protein
MIFRTFVGGRSLNTRFEDVMPDPADDMNSGRTSPNEVRRSLGLPPLIPSKEIDMSDPKSPKNHGEEVSGARKGGQRGDEASNGKRQGGKDKSERPEDEDDEDTVSPVDTTEDVTEDDEDMA